MSVPISLTDDLIVLRHIYSSCTHVLDGEGLVDVLAAGDGEPPAVAVVVARQLDRHVLRRHRGTEER